MEIWLMTDNNVWKSDRRWEPGKFWKLENLKTWKLENFENIKNDPWDNYVYVYAQKSLFIVENNNVFLGHPRHPIHWHHSS